MEDFSLGIPQAKKKFAELELSLLHLQQNVEIPETHLVIHPVIQRSVEQAHNQNVRPSITLIPSKTLNDSTFLNTLQAHVNTWIKSIQAVTKLTRDVSSGLTSLTKDEALCASFMRICWVGGISQSSENLSPKQRALRGLLCLTTQGDRRRLISQHSKDQCYFGEVEWCFS